MTWTDPLTDTDAARAAVRDAVGDTNAADPQLTDELLAPILAAQPDTALAAYQSCLRLIGKYARIAASAVGPLKESAHERIENYTNLAVLYYRLGMNLPPDASIPPTVVPTGGPQGGGSLAGFTSVPPFFTRCWPR
jgi:hypothetical protein